jgi:acyl transferase domain-containing protein/SAM-dependent methyltransferase
MLFSLRKKKTNTALPSPSKKPPQTSEVQARNIAIIGVHGRFAHSPDLESFWENLVNNQVCTEPVPESRWSSDPNSGPPFIGGFLDKVDTFDARLFGVSPNEAREMDPQLRLFMQSAWSAMEDAGYGGHRKHAEKKIGLFVGSMWSDYSLLAHEYGFMRGQYAGPGTFRWAIANRTSFALNLTGPSVFVDSACSSGLLAVHLACRSLLAGECDMVLAGGVNLLLHPSKYELLDREGLLSSDQDKVCFKPGSTGYIPGEGVGSLLLKPLDQAVKDGDNVYAVIKASGSNHNGAGFFFKLPNPAAQVELIQQTLKDASISPETISYVEMSAFGAEEVDTAELASLLRAYKERRNNSVPCALGTLKPLFGHTEAASGLAQILKVVLQLKHRILTPSRFHEQLPDHLIRESGVFVLQRDLTEWTSLQKQPLRAAVSSYGAGGTNVHLILEEVPERPPRAQVASGKEALIVLSALDSERLKKSSQRLMAYLKSVKSENVSLEDIAFTLFTGRDALKQRLGIIARSKSELLERIGHFVEGCGHDSVFTARVVELKKSPKDLASLTLQEVTKAWTEGSRVSWNQVPGAASNPRRVSLPNYPFREDRYWIFGENEKLKAGIPIANKQNENNRELSDALVRFFREKISLHSGSAIKEISEHDAFTDLGLDSLIINKLNADIENRIGKLPKTLFFRYQTIVELCTHLVKEKSEIIEHFLGLDAIQENYPSAPDAKQSTPPVLPLYIKPQPTESNEAIGDIAIIGLSGRYPEAVSLDEFWENLMAGRDCIREVPEERWGQRDWFKKFDGDVDRSYSKWGSFLKDIECFEPLFFEISPKEAVRMDPQERLFLEESWLALESAGYRPDNIGGKDTNGRGRVGVFAGVMWSEYLLYAVEEAQKGHCFTPYSFYFSIPNRVSYQFNFSGPSLALDTACSASLTALHLACESIRNRECDVALAGGVNLSIHPQKYLFLSQHRFASLDGRCRAFGEGGSGYVPGEGVGVVVLKPLKQAIEDGDSIWGVIKASGVSHGGKTNGYTVPNPDSQGELIRSVMDRFSIHPESINYLEAHGTGTSLGDPVEIEGLSQAYAHLTDKKEYCPIGSIKSNIGHLEAAAGVAGLTKVLLQMRHRKLVPSLHSERLNNNIDFSASPFVVQRQLSDWNPHGPDGEPVPRRAGISSFGAGGVGAHVILQESPQYSLADSTGKQMPVYIRHLVPLSAQSSELLLEKAKQLLAALQALRDTEFEKVVYTLQTGRVALDDAVLVDATSRTDLLRALRDFISGKSNEQVYRVERTGSKTREHGCFGFAGDQGFIASYKSGNFQPFVNAWKKGQQIFWEALWDKQIPGRVELPGTLFERQSYWLPISEGSVQKAPEVSRTELPAASSIHPFIDSNNSTFYQQTYSKRFSARAAFIAEHQVQQHHYLPGVVMLEMARVGGCLAAEAKVVTLSDIAWQFPIDFTDMEERTVTLNIVPDSEGATFEFLIALSDGILKSCAVGRLGFAEQVEAGKNDQQVPSNGQAYGFEHSLNASQAYDQLAQMGLEYGPRLRGIESLHYGSESAVAFLRKPEGPETGLGFDPGLLDGVLQAAALHASLHSGELLPVLPYMLERLNLYSELSDSCYARIRIREYETVEGVKEVGCDLNLYDEQGIHLLQIEAFRLREVTLAHDVIAQEVALVTLQPEWLDIPLEAAPVSPQTLLVFDQASDSQDSRQHEVSGIFGVEKVYRVYPADKYNRVSESSFEINPLNLQDLNQLLEDLGTIPGKIIYLWSWGMDEQTPKAWTGAIESHVYFLFHFLKILSTHRLKETVRILHLSNKAYCISDAMSMAWSGFAKSLTLEKPEIVLRSIQVELPESDLNSLRDTLLTRLLQEFDFRADHDHQVRYKGSRREVKRYTPLEWEPSDTTTAQFLKPSGIYLVTGGLGGLGLIFTRYLLRQSEASTIVLTGRSSLNPDKESILDSLNQQSSRVVYRKADISNYDECQQLIDHIGETYGTIDGVIHSAGLVKDAFLINKSYEDCMQVLGPKILGTLNLDHCLGNSPLDFMALFSSTNAMTGNPGQVDYSYANAFMDNFAFVRQRWCEQGLRKGVTLSFNWPYWKEGGMQLDTYALEALESRLGMVPLSTVHGEKVFEQALNHSINQVVAIEGHREAILNALEPAERDCISGEVEKDQLATELSEEVLREKTLAFLTDIISATTEMPREKVLSHLSFDSFGIDSVMIMSMNRRLGQHFDKFSKTLFYEYKTIEELCAYFLEKHVPALQKLFADVPVTHGNNGDGAKVSQPEKATDTFSEQLQTQERRPLITKYRSNDDSHSYRTNNMPIAIIGVDGRFPEANNLKEFWNNIKAGKDCVREIPKDRWDFTPFFDASKGKVGKTYTKWGGFLKEIDRFDPLCFRIAPRDAEIMCPQERLFLETCWHTVEDAGYRASDLARLNVGVFAGVMWNQYQLLGVQDSLAGRGISSPSMISSVANRVSYTLNLSGPSIGLDTMCSSSLTALHLACESIRRGDCQWALAGGINLMVHPVKYNILSQNNIASTDGRCRSFGEGGDGYVPAEGVGAVLLKPLAQAESDGDHIYGVIRGSAINHGGRTNGYTVPNPLAQTEVIRVALERSGVKPQTIQYIEAHGTGTALGDPIEINGIERAFDSLKEGNEHGNNGNICSISSVKSVIGHAESAAGIAGLIKILLQFQHGQLCPTLHTNSLNPNIDFEATRLRVQRTLEPWPRLLSSENGVMRELPRKACLSGFGAGGSNAHIVVEESIQVNGNVETLRGPWLFLLSARTRDRLQVYAKCWLEWLADRPESTRLADVAYTLQVGREGMEARVAFLANDWNTFRERMEAIAVGDESPILYRGLIHQDSLDTVSQVDAERFESALSEKDLRTLAELWSRSNPEIDWSRLYPEHGGRRVSLPRYPFEKKRCWITATSTYIQEGAQAIASAQAVSPVAKETQSNNEGDDWKRMENLFCIRDWAYKPLAETKAFQSEGPVLVLLNQDAPQALVDALNQDTTTTWHLVAPAGASENHARWQFDYNDYQSGVEFNAQVRESCIDYRCIVDFSDVTAQANSSEYTPYGRIAFLKECVSSLGSGTLSIMHFSYGLSAVQPEKAGTSGAIMAGLLKPLGFEYSRVSSKTADIDEFAANLETFRFYLNQLYSSTDLDQSFRNRLRYIPVLKRLTGDFSPNRPGDTLSLFDSRKVYVVTGGTSGIGFEMARHLVDNGARKLALLGYNPLPPRDQWESLLATVDARTSHKLRTLIEFEQWGVTYHTYFGELTDAESLESFFNQVHSSMGSVGGVIHSATTKPNKNPYFINKSKEELQGLFEPKINGLHILRRLLDTGDLDFFVLFSSVASALPSRGKGTVHYAAANNYLDCFVRYQHLQGRNYYKSINWVYWLETGGVAGEENRKQLSKCGIYPITNQEGRYAFDKVLASQRPLFLSGRLSNTLLQEGRLDNSRICFETRQPVQKATKDAVLESLTLDYKNGLCELEAHRDSQIELRSYCLHYLAKCLRDQGLFCREGERHTLETVSERINALPGYKRLLASFLTTLEYAGWLSRNGDVFLPTQLILDPATIDRLQHLDTIGKGYTQTYPIFAPFIDLVDACMSKFREILTGQVTATDVMFPKGRMDLVENVYRGNPIVDFCNFLVARGVCYAVEEILRLDPHTKVKIVEIGSGTGSTSARVLEAIKDYAASVSYRYTDISQGFLHHGQQNYQAKYPFLEFSILNIEKPVVAQGLKYADYHIVLATNVIHATEDMDATTRHVKQLLKPGGYFFLNELTELHDFATLSFGWLEGWWRFSDVGRRIPGAPLLAQEAWLDCLGTVGFKQCHCLGVPSFIRDGSFHQSLFISQSDGSYEMDGIAEPQVQTEAEKPNQSFFHSHKREESAHNSIQSTVALGALVKEMFAETLKVSPQEFDDQTSFGAYGVDSILMGDIVARLEKRFNLTLNPSLILENDTFAQLVPALEILIGSTASNAATTSTTQPQGGTLNGAGNQQRLLMDRLKSVFADTLKIDPAELNPRLSFGNFGVDSILMSTLVGRLETELNTSLNPSILIENDTLARLCETLSEIITLSQTRVAQANTVVEPVSNSSGMNVQGESPAFHINTGGMQQGRQQIAVIGMGCDFPKAPTLEMYWQNLKEARNCIREVPASRWDSSRLYVPADQWSLGKALAKWGGFLDQVDQFDAAYFNIPEEDAPYLNPMIRKLLEVSAQTIAHSGREIKELWGEKVGVYVGSRVNEYAIEIIRKQNKNRLTGIGQNFIAAQVSHFMNWSGPNFVVDSACSSSLTSVHLACQGLLTGDCDYALAAGVDLILDERPFLILSEMGALSPDGICRTFDEGANGFVPGEGCGSILLKTLDKALADGDHIYGVIDSSAINNDGNTMGITTPNPDAQEAVIQAALDRAKINPDTISYMEAHGTGTLIGDPIELQALTRVFRKYTQDRQFCGVGSVKTNMGHLLSAAGIAGIIKILLSLNAGKIVPTLNCLRPNPRFKFDDSPFRICQKLESWMPRQGIIRAGISSFGLGGSNGHVILSQLNEQQVPVYKPQRKALPAIQFKRKPYWMEYRSSHKLSKWFPQEDTSPQPSVLPERGMDNHKTFLDEGIKQIEAIMNEGFKQLEATPETPPVAVSRIGKSPVLELIEE